MGRYGEGMWGSYDIGQNYQSAMGIYTSENQFNFDTNMLISLGFSTQEIDTLQYIIANGGKTTVDALTSYGLNYDGANRLREMYDIVSGKRLISTKEDFSRHLRKINGAHKKITVDDLMISTVQEVPKAAIVAKLKPPYDVFNSDNPGYKPWERLYKVVSVGSTQIVVKTKRRPVLRYGEAKKIDGVLNIREVHDNYLVVAFNKKYCKLCNRFIVVASTKKPEIHHGLIEIICIEGTPVYVYARSLGTKSTISYKGATQRVYDYGYFTQEIRPKLMKVGTKLYHDLVGVVAYEECAVEPFSLIIPEGRVMRKKRLDEIEEDDDDFMDDFE